MLSTLLSHAISPVEEILYPAACPICGMSIKRGSEICCPACDRQLVRLSHPVCAVCHRYLLPNGLGCNCDDTIAFPQRIAGLGVFDSGLRAIIHGLKYHGCRSMAAPLAMEMSRQLGSFPSVDAIVAIPTAPHRRRERGFGHAELLAECLARVMNRPYLPNAIGFTRRVADQTRLSGNERMANLRGAFKPLDVSSLERQSVLIVDDVMTTGATMAEAGRVLMEAGAVNTFGCVVALNLGHIPDGPPI